MVDVDTNVYYSAGRELCAAATAWSDAIFNQVHPLRQCANMCGSYQEATAWAAKYDAKAAELLHTADELALAANAYGRVLMEAGYNHELGDHFATTEFGASLPPRPQMPEARTWGSYIVPIGTAGGRGSGLEEVIGLASEVGITVPDGDVGKLTNAGAVWKNLSTAAAVTGFSAELHRIAGLFSEITADEYDSIDEDIREMKNTADSIIGGFSDIAGSVEVHRAALVAMREGIMNFLEEMAKEIAIQIGVTAFVSIAASFVTFGLAAAVGTAVAAGRLTRIVSVYGPKIRPLVVLFKNEGLIHKFDNIVDMAQNKQKLKELRKLDPAKSPGRSGLVGKLDQADREVLAWGPSDKRGADLNNIVRNGETPTPEQQAQIDKLNEALGKLPKHEGEVVRHVNMNANDLAAMEKGKSWSDPGFMSTSNKPEGVSDVFADSKNVEMQIISKNGRKFSDPDTGQSFGTDCEVLFPSNTKFIVGNKFVDPATGRTVVQMVEQ
ncbi:ADP-ribosyltransferase [Nocardia sp. NPDC058519]|uniref:ADP-ribosyltransferase n=1 Tax=Nocardia sp. NPDC058519 TaxID=3346535 RepID=UPI003651B421